VNDAQLSDGIHSIQGITDSLKTMEKPGFDASTQNKAFN